MEQDLQEQEQKKVFSVRREIWKLLNEGYTTEQIEEWLTIKVENGEIKMWQVISALVQSRAEELDYKNKIEGVLELLS